MSYYLPIAAVVVSNIVYHVCQKVTPEKLDPFLALSITYLTAFAVSVSVFFLNRTEPAGNMGFSVLYPSVLLGIAITGLEAGFLFAYRKGWNISIAALFANTLVAVCLIPVGILFFAEKITLCQAAGIVLCLAGLFLTGL